MTTLIEKVYAAFVSINSSCDRLKYFKNQLSHKEEYSLRKLIPQEIVNLIENIMLLNYYPLTTTEFKECLTEVAIRNMDYSMGYWGNKYPYGLKQVYTLLELGWTNDLLIAQSVNIWAINCTIDKLYNAIYDGNVLPYKESIKKNYIVRRMHK